MTTSITLRNSEEIQSLHDIFISEDDGNKIEGDGNQLVNSDDFPLKHTFADGVYGRQMDMKAGSAVVGAIHNHVHVWFLLTGSLAVATEDSTEEFIAPCYVLAKPGSKRVIYAIEDSIFVNVHKNPKKIKNIEKLEKEKDSLTFEDYEEYINKTK